MNDHTALVAAITAAIRIVLPEIIKEVREAVAADMPQQIIRPADVHHYIGLKHSARDAAVASGRLKRPIKISERAVAFLASDIAAFQRQRIAERDAEAALPETTPPAPKVKKIHLKQRNGGA